MVIARSIKCAADFANGAGRGPQPHRRSQIEPIASLRPGRNAVSIGAYPFCDAPLRKPITGTVGWQRAATGHAAALPRSAMKLRRVMQNCPSRTSLPKGSVVRHSKIGPPMTLWVILVILRAALNQKFIKDPI